MAIKTLPLILLELLVVLGIVAVITVLGWLALPVPVR